MKTKDDIEAERAALWEDHRAKGQVLTRLAVERSPYGLTPDSVKASPEYQEAKSACAKAFQALRRFNTQFKP